MTYSIRLDDDAGTSIWLRPANVGDAAGILFRGENVASPTPRVVQYTRAGRSGVDDFTEFHDAAQWTCQLELIDYNGTTRWQLRDQLAALLRADRRPWLYILRDGWLTERRARIRGTIATPVDSLSTVRLECAVQADIPAGYLEDPTETTGIPARPGVLLGGRVYPKLYGWQYSAGGSGSTIFLTNSGTEPTPLLLRLYGGCTDPVITNVTTGEQVEFDGLTILRGSYLEIDMDAHTAMMDGDPALSYYEKVNFQTSTWWRLVPGVNQLRVGANVADATCELFTYWHNRYAL